MAHSKWFYRLKNECKKISPHIRFKRLKMGYYRIFWNHVYLHEVFEDMPAKGYDIERENPRLYDRNYYEEYEDNIETVRRVKNYVEGYYDSLDHIKTKVYMHRHDKEFNQNAERMYRQVVVK